MTPRSWLRFAAASFALLICPGPAQAAGDEPTGPSSRADSAQEFPQESRPLGPAPDLRPQPADAQGSGSARSFLETIDPRRYEVTRVGGALAVVLTLLVLARVLMRRVAGPLAGGGRPSGVVEVLARYPVGKGQQLVLLKLGRRIALLHQSRTGMTTLTEVSDPDEVAGLLARLEAGTRDRADGRFQTLLQRWTSAPEEPAPPSQGAEVIDLTRRRAGAVSSSWAGRAGS